MKRFAEQHVAELDGIRGIACLLVIVLHCGIGLTLSTPGSWGPAIYGVLSPFLVGGVDLFFVLSGFLIGGLLIDYRTAPNYFAVFWIRRAARILPVYFLLLGTYVTALAVKPYLDVPWADKWLLLDPLPLWSYVSFTNNNLMAYYGETGAFWVGITWSLCVEEQFYLIFPFIVFYFRPRTVFRICIAGIILAPLVRAAIWTWGSQFYMGYFPTPARMDALMFGVLVAIAVRRSDILAFASRWRRYLDMAAVATVILLSGVVWRVPTTVQFSLVGAGSAYAILRVFISDGLYRRLLAARWIVGAGLISYPLYMYHQAINGMMHGFIANQVPTIATWRDMGIAAAVVVLAVSLATISTLYFESIFRRLGRKVRYISADPCQSIPMAPLAGLRQARAMRFPVK